MPLLGLPPGLAALRHDHTTLNYTWLHPQKAVFLAAQLQTNAIRNLSANISGQMMPDALVQTHKSGFIEKYVANVL